MYEKIQEDLQHLSKQIIEVVKNNNQDGNIELIVQSQINLFLKDSLELIFKNQKTLRKREALNLFSNINKKDEKQKTERKTRKKKNEEQKLKISLIPLNGDLKGFYLYPGSDLLLIRNGNENYSAVANYKDENLKSLNEEDIEFCIKNSINIIDINNIIDQQ